MGATKKLYPESGLSKFDIRKDFAKNTKEQSENKILEVKPVNVWMEEAKNKPIPSELLGCLWYQGELGILFADTNLGKSVFAVQIADALTSQKEIKPFKQCDKKMRVLYCDFEMSDKQFENRYSKNYSDSYTFSSDVYRAELNLDKYLTNTGNSIENQITNEIVNHIINNDIDVVIIDNLTYIVNEIEKSKNIAPIMKQLKFINKEYGTSILVLAHTPKRDLSRPLNSSDINGSKFLSNFADSIFAIGKSANDETYRYVKQIKSRNSSIIFGSDNVAVFEIVKNFNFLQFNFIRTDSEIDHLQLRNKTELEELDTSILQEHKEFPDKSYGQIADKFSTNKMRVKRVIDRNS